MGLGFRVRGFGGFGVLRRFGGFGGCVVLEDLGFRALEGLGVKEFRVLGVRVQGVSTSG